MRFTVPLIVLSVLILCTAGLTGCQLAAKEPTKNFGVAGVEINGVGKPNEGPDSADDVVPTAEALTDHLTRAGYSITRRTDLGDSALVVDRIYADKGSSFIDICYGTSETDAQEIFRFYEKTYPRYYITAINGDYVYCIGDKNAFKNAGFSSLANFGTQYIYK